MEDQQLFFEDLELGRERELGSFSISKEDIVSFATEYDPQPYHVDEDAAEDSPFGGLVASGWHTLCLSTRVCVDGFRGSVSTMGGVGVDNLAWRTPARPGDTLTVNHEVIDKRVTESDPSRGLMRESVTVSNQRGETVLTYEVIGLVERKQRADVTSQSGQHSYGGQ